MIEPNEPDAPQSPEQNPANDSDSPPPSAGALVLAAQERYFQAVQEVWGGLRSRILGCQAELARDVERACLAQDPNAYQTAFANYQREYQTAFSAEVSTKAHDEAFRTYKASLAQAISGVATDDLTITDLAHIAQSIYQVAPVAMSLVQAQAGTMPETPTS